MEVVREYLRRMLFRDEREKHFSYLLFDCDSTFFSFLLIKKINNLSKISLTLSEILILGFQVF